MRRTRPFIAKRHVTMLALVRTDAQMDANVTLEVRLLDELLGTVRALVSGTHVDQHVLAERIAPSKLFAAIGAL